MNEERLLELMHGEIDGANSARKSGALNRYLLDHPGARTELEELKRLTNLLTRITPVEPPENLRKNIINAAAVHAAGRARRDSRRSPLFSVLFGRTMRLAYAFAGGIALGIILLVLWKQPGGRDSLADIERLSGTIMPGTAAERYRPAGALDIRSGPVNGSLTLSLSDRGALVLLKLRSGEPVEVVVGYDPQSLRFSGIREFDPGQAAVQADAGNVRLTMIGENQVLIALSRISASTPPVNLRIVRAGAVVVEQSVGFDASHQ